MADGAHGLGILNGFYERKVALVLIDIQNKFAKSIENIDRSMTSKLDYINEVADEFRMTGNPVIRVLFDGESFHGEGIENPDDPVDGLKLADTDVIVHKAYMNSFRESDLEKTVKDLGCTGIVLAGMVAHYCVIATYYAAFDHGIVSYILKGGVASTDEETAACVERITKAVDLEDIRKNVNFQKRPRFIRETAASGPSEQATISCSAIALSETSGGQSLVPSVFGNSCMAVSISF